MKRKTLIGRIVVTDRILRGLRAHTTCKIIGREKGLLSFFARENHITQVARLFGIWNLFLHIRIEDHEKLQNLIIQLRGKFDIIDNYEIIPIFEDVAINLMPV